MPWYQDVQVLHTRHNLRRCSISNQHYFSLSLTSHRVVGMVKRQRMRSEMARVVMKTFLAVRMLSCHSTDQMIRMLPSRPVTRSTT